MVNGVGFVAITVAMKDGRVFRLQRDHETPHFGYCWQGREAYKLKMQLEMALIETGDELLTLMERYIEEFQDFIIGDDEQGTAFRDSISSITDFSKIDFVTISEETSYEEGESLTSNLEFYNTDLDEEVNQSTDSNCGSELPNKPVTAFSYQDVDFVHKDYFKKLITITDNDVAIDAPKSKRLTIQIDGEEFTISHNLKPHIVKLLGDATEYDSYAHVLHGCPRNIWPTSICEPTKRVLCSDFDYHGEYNLVSMQVYTRLGFFFKICKLCEDPDVLEAILRYVCKFRNKRVHIAVTGCACTRLVGYGDRTYMHCLVAVPAGGNEWNLQIEEKEINRRNIESMYETMVVETPAPFNIVLDANKYTPLKAENKVRIMLGDITVGLPIVTLPDGRAAFAHCPQLVLDNYAGVLVKRGDAYEIVVPDISRTIQTKIGTHVMTVMVTNGEVSRCINERMTKLMRIEQYFEGIVPWEEIAEMVDFATHNYFREVMLDERVISYCLAYSLSYLQLLADQTKTDFEAWTKSAKLKKDGTFHKSHTQTYYVDNDDVNSPCRSLCYYCGCDSDTVYRIKPYLTYDDSSVREECRSFMAKKNFI